MAPTYMDGDVTVINRLAYALSDPSRGDVVSVRWDGELLLKRVVGLPGETVAIVAGQVNIDGRFFEEPYVKADAGWNFVPRQLEKDHYLVIGDNRGMHPQHQTFGVVSREQILGKTLF